MSDYQYVHFLALDRPLDEGQLEFMRRQSSRAEITRWEFTNEYHYAGFRGDAQEMLRRGFDVHLLYANFGIRRLMFRLPAGLPCDREMFDVFRVEYAIDWKADKHDEGGILVIRPEADAETYDEQLYDLGSLLAKIAPSRNLLIGGDLRPLYLAWLACKRLSQSGSRLPAPRERAKSNAPQRPTGPHGLGSAGDRLEPPVPAGLGQLPPALVAMAGFYELDDDLVQVAAERSPPIPQSPDSDQRLQAWIAGQSNDALRGLVHRFLAGDAAAARAETLARIRGEAGPRAWPTAEPTRTFGQLCQAAAELNGRRLQRQEQARQQARSERLAAIAADPRKTIANVERLVALRSAAGYEQAARELTDLQEALGPESGPEQAGAVAEKLRRENPKRNRLIATLRRHGFLATALPRPGSPAPAG